MGWALDLRLMGTRAPFSVGAVGYDVEGVFVYDAAVGVDCG
jgi:hypothetical protein